MELAAFLVRLVVGAEKAVDRGCPVVAAIRRPRSLTNLSVSSSISTETGDSDDWCLTGTSADAKVRLMRSLTSPSGVTISCSKDRASTYLQDLSLKSPV